MAQNNDLSQFDEMKLYYGNDYEINEKIVVHQPRIGEIINMGEGEYFDMIHTLTCIPSDMKSRLWDNGIDYEEISDFDLFCMLAPSLPIKNTHILFGETIDFSQMHVYTSKTESDRKVLAVLEKEIIIDEYVYLKLIFYLRKIHNLIPKVEKAGTPGTKKILIDLDREDHEKAKKGQKTSNLLPLISSLLNSPGFKYTKKELIDVCYYEFIDCVRRTEALKQAEALLQGIYSGNIDSKKLNKEHLNGFRELSKKA